MNLDAKQLLQSYQPKAAAKPLNLDQQVCVVRYSPCGKVLAVGSFDARVRRWSAAAEPLTEILPSLTGHSGWVQTLAFHGDGQRLFSADTWGQLCCWPYADRDANSLWQVAQAHDGWVRQLAVSPDGKSVASCGSDRMVRIWSADGKKLREWPDHGQDVHAVAFHPSGALLSGDLKGVVKQWDLATGKCVRSFDAGLMYLYDRIQDVGGVRCLAFDRPGGLLLCGGSKPQGGGFVQATPLLLAFDWQTGRLLHTLQIGTQDEGFIHDLAWHPAGFVIAVTSGQPGRGKLFFQRLADAQPFWTSTGMANCHSLAVHPGGTRLIVAATNGGSNGNGRRLNKNKEYPGNWSPLFAWDLPAK